MSRWHGRGHAVQQSLFTNSTLTHISAAPLPLLPLPQAPLDDLLGGSSAPPAAPISGGFAPIVAWQGSGLRLVFGFAKPVASNPGLTTITTTVSNDGMEALEGFNLQVGVYRD